MRAVRLFAPADVRCVEIDVPQVESASDVIVKVNSCGVCGSDIARVMVKGAYHYPITIGHEFAGEVVDIADGVKTLKPGDRVTVMPLIPCGQCKYCRIGQYITCDSYDYYGSRIDGAMAEFIRVSAANILKIPDGIDFESASMTDPVSVALHAVRQANIIPGQTAAVFGMGAIGLLTVQWLKSVGCREVFAVDIFDEKLELAKKLGADYCLNGRSENAKEMIMKHTGDEGVDVAIELVGNKITQVQAIQAVRKQGTVIYCGISYDDLLIPNAELSKILRGELILKGAWNSSIAPLPINEWETSLDFMATGKIRTDSIISHRFKLEQCQDCFNMMHNRTEIFNKVLFKPHN